MKGTLLRSLFALLLVACLITSFACGPGAKFELGELSISPAEVVEGGSVAVSVDVTNAGQAEGTFEARLKIDNTLAETKNVSIAAGETTTVSFTVDANVAGIHDVKLNNIVGQFSVLTPPQFANLVISPTEVEAGEQATVSADVTNTGEISGNYTITLRVNDADEETKTVAIGAGETKTASFALTISDSGTYSISLGGLSGSLTVLKPAGFAMSNLVISPIHANAGREVSILCDVTNTGELDGSCPVNLMVDGVQADSKEVTVAAGTTQTVAFSLVKDIGGTYQIAIGNLTNAFVVSEGMLPTLHVGDQWVFRGIYSGVAYTITEKIVGEEFIQGKDCYVKEVTYDPSISGISKATYWIEKATLDILRSQYSFEYSGVTVTCSTVYDPKYPGRGPWPKTVGSEWSETGTITETCVVPGNSNTDTESYSMNYKVEKVEDITVGAGTFRCLKIVVYENGVATQNHWYSDKTKTFVKIVYLSDQDGEQLLSYSVK